MFAKNRNAQLTPSVSYANVAGPSSTASASYQDALSTNIGESGVEKVFDIDWSCEAYITGLQNEVQVRVYNVTDALVMAEGQLATPISTIAQDYHFMGGIDQIIITGIKNIKIQFRALTGGTAYIRRIRIRAREVI